MSEEIKLTLNSPITEEQWDAITDVDFDHTNEIIFNTKNGKVVKFVKAGDEYEEFTKEELSAIKQGISIKLLSLRSAQTWKTDEKTADEILFLERLYRKIERNLEGV